MPLTLRPGKPEDATLCGIICYDAFKAIADQHNFPPGYASPEAAVARMVVRLTHPGMYAVVAEFDGQVVGSNFLDERAPIVGLGPITVAPAAQNHTISRHLMQDVLDRAAAWHVSPGSPHDSIAHVEGGRYVRKHHSRVGSLEECSWECVPQRQLRPDDLRDHRFQPQDPWSRPR